MSWKGMVKAVTRLPHQVMARTGHADTTVDDEFEHMNAQFEVLSEAAARLHEDAAKFKKSVETMVEHQTAFAATLLDVYSPISGSATRSPPGTISAGSSPVKADGTGAAGVPSLQPQTTGGSLKRVYTPPESYEAVQAYMRQLDAIREPLAQELAVVNRRIILPTADLLEVLKGVAKTITKRNHKLTDYDRYRVDAAKLKNAPNKDAKDERRMITLEQQLQQATHEFAVLNDALKQQLPHFFALRTSFVDPCFKSLYILQRKVYRMLASTVEPLQHSAQGIDWFSDVVQGFKAKHTRVEASINQLAILKFTPAALAAAQAGVAGLTVAGAPASGGVSAHATGASGNTQQPPAPAYSTLPPQQQQQQQPQFAKQFGAGVPTAAGAGASVPTQASVVPTLAGKDGTSPFGNPAAVPGAYGSVAAGAGGAGYAAVQPPPVPAGPPAVVVKVVTAQYDFDGQQADDLPFKTGDRIEVLEMTGSINDWWKGRVHGRVGYFPANYTV